MLSDTNDRRHNLPPNNHSASKSRRKKGNKPRFFQITDEIISDAPSFFEDPQFTVIHRQPEVRQFIHDFWRWNAQVLWLLSSTSHPYIELQKKLATMVGPYLGETIIDLGCGTGNFCGRLFQTNGKAVGRIFAIDIDWESLAQVPHTLRGVGYRGQVALMQTSTMSSLPIWNESVDNVVSSLGGLMYAGWWFETIDGKIQLAHEGKEALKKCLLDLNRIIKLGGHLAFSTIKPNPDFRKILFDSIWSLIKQGQLNDLFKYLRTGFRAKKLSHFMHELEMSGHAHYLSLDEWDGLLNEAGFTIIEENEGEYYAKQGILVVARKVRNVN